MNNGRFSDGLLIGMVIGGVAVFLLGTKKGNKILKTITEDGLAGLGEIAKDFENDARREAKVQLKKVESKIEDLGDSIVIETTPQVGQEEKVATKRFFRKTAKN
jgi:gas vesicle protein